MKGGTVQINWHEGKPVLTLDFHPISGFLATGGADFDIKLWSISSGEAQKNVPTASYCSSLSYHGSTVNVIRFSPSGDYLASGADGGELVIWKCHTTETGQTWKVLKSLSFHRKDVLDLEWSPDSEFLISGSVDNSCIIWDINKGSVHQMLDSHFHYVQGVAWDPLSKYVASLSSDRTCRIYFDKPQKKTKVIEKNYVCQHTISKSAKNYLFHDETLPSFFRRLAWSPDGSFLLVPAGSYKVSSSPETVNTSYVFSRKDLSRPALLLPGANKPVIAVRFCPIAFSLKGSGSDGFFKLPYRLVFAVATINSLYIYDTDSVSPIAILAGLHYAAITDIAWSSCAQYLAVSSQDGYCTLVEFQKDELGSPIKLAEEKREPQASTGHTYLTPEQKREEPNENTNPVEAKPEGMNIDESPVAADTDKRSTAKNETEQASPCSTNTPVLEPEGMMIDKGRVAADTSNTPTAKNAGEQATLCSTHTPVRNKPTKKRITPMAIDPQ